MSELTQREVTIFNAARLLSGSERFDFLDEACADQPALRLRLDELLQVSESEADFLERPARGDLGTAARQSQTLPDSAPFTEKPGDRIGPYKLLELVGEGGCGVVYAAAQTEPVRRRVALKVIKVGMDTKQVVARFEAERQALAMMDHPNIAKVLEAGTTETGRPYFVMELVRGIRITEYCDQNQLTTKERLDLFIKVCQAIQHAHQKGIIHRDIKPSNILVTLHDGVPVPKVIDFGIAKATEGKLTEETIYTQLHHFIGTPAYMSPEQAEMSGLNIDTRSDIYSLGVLLYELLAGDTPFDAKALLASGLEAMRKTICQKEPVCPSTRIAALQGEELTATARHRATDAPKLTRQLQGDLDWIVMKCLEKDRARRFETVNGLAMDVLRHLKNEPVTARPPSPIYRFGKMVRRNKGAFAAITAIVAALIIGLGVSAWMIVKEKRARDEAEAARANEARLRRKADVKANVAQAYALYLNGEGAQAKSRLDAIPPSLMEPDYMQAALCRRLGCAQAYENQWRGSVADFAVLLKVDRLDGSHRRDLDYQWYGTALLELGDTNGYSDFQQGVVTQFSGETNPITAGRMARTILLLPPGQKWVAPLGAFYDQTARFRNYTGAFNARLEPLACVSLGLIDYRRGDYAKAVAWCRRSLACPKSDADGCEAQLILAMSHYQLQRVDEARFALAYGRAPIDRFFQTKAGKLKVAGKIGENDEITFFDWLEARILLREAAALIGGKPFPGGISPAEARTKFEQTVKLCNAGRYQETEKLLNETPASVLLLSAFDAGNAFEQVGWWHLQNHQWAQAEASWHPIAFGPDEDASLLAGRALPWFCLAYAPLLLEMGQTNDYEKLRLSVLSTCGDTGDPLNAMRVLTVCLLRPPQAAMTAKLDKLAETVARRDPRQTNWTATANASLALLSCRRGDYEQTMRWLAKDSDLSSLGPAMAARYQVLAAWASIGLGQRDQARSELAGWAGSVEKNFNTPLPFGGDIRSEAWHGWSINHLLLLEVKGLIKAAPKPEIAVKRG